MKSWNKAAIGLLVASAMALGTGVVASADSANTSTGSSSSTSQASQTQPSQSSDKASGDTRNSAKPNAELKQPESPVASASSQPAGGKVSTPQQTESETKQAQEASGAQAQQKSGASSLTRSQQQPQAQDSSDPSIKFQVDWGGNEDGSEKVHWYVQETAPHEDVVHIGPGVMGSYYDSPAQALFTDPVGSTLRNDIVRIVFDDAPDTHVVATSDFDLKNYPNLKSIDNVGNIDFSRFDGTDEFYMAECFGFNPQMKTLDLTGWGADRTAPGAGLPGSKPSSKWKTGMTFNMQDMFDVDPGLTTITGLDHWDTSAVTDMAGMFRTDVYGHSQLRSIGDLSGWDMSNVVYTSDMFDENLNLTDVGDLSGWNLKSAKIAEWMFSNTSISTLGDVSNWGMGNVTDMQGIFAGMKNLTALPGIKNWDVRKNTWFICMFQGDHALTSLDLTGWHTDSATNMYCMFNADTSLTQIKGLGDLNVSGVTDMSYVFYHDANLTSLDLSGWDTRHVTDGSKAFTPHLDEIKLGPNTRLDSSFFDYSKPLFGGAMESSGYTGRWTKSDNSWTSDASDDNGSLSALTQDSGFAGGTYVWQEFAEVSFRKNAPKGVKVSGSPVTIRKVGAKAEDIKIKVPRLMFHAKNLKFLGWNSGKQGGQMSFKRGDIVTNFNRGENIRLWAQWQSKGVPSTPLVPAALEYRIHYEANAPQGLTATGSVPDDVFTVDPASGVDLLHYRHQVTKKEFKVEGYKLLTWTTREDMHGGFYDGGSEIRVAPGTTTLYAVWAKDTTVISAPTTSAKPVTPVAPTAPTKPEKPTKPTNPTTPIRPTLPETPTNPSTPKVPTVPTQNQASQNVANNSRNTVTRSALAPLTVLPVAAPAFAPAQRVAGNAVAPAPVAGSDGVASLPQQQRPRPKCIPEGVYQKMKFGKRGNEPVYWIEPDGSAYVQNSAWSLSDYNGLPQCSIEASAPTSGGHMSFNFWWLLVFLVPLFLLLLAYRNNNYILARHRNLDSVNI
ncbi:BspA family leucine-rich repeat surface protein [Bifidobacterium sp. ESL0690]|uniref:BspA family leucine-rich repeat surface protein n=1 Tax=Bifidobacterium sp. ESL0690 TaxID=2983214 RepID=UPI0023F91FB6|nr:BspA family leucine-rich repeat surface protein [Bifidobacterium sp. ESL0690]WEV46420.1 BspA family leucine-rich repeat surface protein [Bifidobacterium sp. ESL0690]